MAIINTGFGTQPKSFCFSFRNKKIKQNKKVLAKCLIESLITFKTPTNHSRYPYNMNSNAL